MILKFQKLCNQCSLVWYGVQTRCGDRYYAWKLWKGSVSMSFECRLGLGLPILIDYIAYYNGDFVIKSVFCNQCVIQHFSLSFSSGRPIFWKGKQSPRPYLSNKKKRMQKYCLSFEKSWIEVTQWPRDFSITGSASVIPGYFL